MKLHFDLSEENEEEEKERKQIMTFEEKLIKRKLKNESIHGIKARHLSDLCVLPRKEEEYIITTYKQFNAYSVILYLIEKVKIKEINICTFRMNVPTAESLIELSKREGVKINFILCSIATNNPQKHEKAVSIINAETETNKNINAKYVNVHAKVTIISSNEGVYYLEGSGNMTDNGKVEQYRFGNSEKIYNFHKSWMKEI